MSFRHRLMHRGNAIGLWIHHAFKGRLDAFGDQTVLMVTSPGRRTGRPRSTMVRYLDHDGGYLVWGTGSGSPTDPDWFRNLRRGREASIEIGTRAESVTPTELRGVERDLIWREVILAKAPAVGKYEAKAGRIIPVAVLRPDGTTRQTTNRVVACALRQSGPGPTDGGPPPETAPTIGPRPGCQRSALGLLGRPEAVVAR